MQFDYDPAKRQINIEKHGVDFLEVGAVLLDTNRIDGLDLRRTFGEERRICLGQSGLRLYVVVYTTRHDRIRIISARKANDREQQKYRDSDIGRH